ncbi:MAG: hypothetical protein V4671_04125 [Armatimonadota bacterium]
MNPAIRQPAVPRLTDRDLLEKQAKSRNAMAACEAQVAAPYFSVVSFDPYTNTAQIVKDGEASRVHTVDLNTGECDCVLQESVTKINRKLVAERSDIRCTVKCRRIIDHLEIYDPYCLANAPHPDELLVADAPAHASVADAIGAI